MPEVRRLTRSDLSWVVALAAARRRVLHDFAPRFWRSAPDAAEAQAAFLGALIDADEVLSIRTDHGFLVGVPREDRLLVDDFVLGRPSAWPADGSALLARAAAEAPLRIVCPVPEQALRTTVEALGAVPAESWWHRDLVPPEDEPSFARQAPPPAATGALEVDGTAGRLVEAPPVYAPGGPVLLVTAVRDPAALAGIEDAALHRGSTVSVVSVRADDADRAELVKSAGYRRTTDFYLTSRAVRGS